MFKREFKVARVRVEALALLVEILKAAQGRFSPQQLDVDNIRETFQQELAKTTKAPATGN